MSNQKKAYRDLAVKLLKASNLVNYFPCPVMLSLKGFFKMRPVFFKIDPILDSFFGSVAKGF